MKHKPSKSHDKQYLNVICPMCGAFKGKSCVHTSKSKKGKKRSVPHEDREKLAKVKLSESFTKHLNKVDEKPKKNPHDKLTSEQKATLKIILDKITVLGRHVEFVGPVSEGPLIETYRVFPLRHTKVNHLEAMSKDFAVALGAESVLVKRMPGESAVGIFVPKAKRGKVLFSETLPNVSSFMKEKTEDGHKPIPMNLGIDSDGEPMVDDLTQQPHVLIAGSTHSGKSTEMLAMCLSMLWEMSPNELQIIISDTKGVEFKHFVTMPHLRFPVCINVYKTMEALEWCVKETQIRLTLFGTEGVRNIHEYNDRTVSDGKLPYIVIFIDELADVIAEGPEVAKGEAKVNASKLGTIVARARASGIHVVAATQRPSVNIVKGSIKANFPTRLSFKLTSQTDSRTVLNTKGAENLMGKGDGLYQSSCSSDLRRIHAPYTSLDELKSMITSIMQRHQPSLPVGASDTLFGKESTYKNPN